MATFTQALTLDVGAKTQYQHLYAKQADANSRFVKVTMMANGEQIIPETGASAKIRALKPDGTGIFNPAVINEDGTITAELTDQLLAVKGVVVVDIMLIGTANEILSTASFSVKVEEAPAGEVIISSNEFLELIEMRGAVDDALAASEAASAAAAEASEAAGAAAEAAAAASEEVERVKHSSLSDFNNDLTLGDFSNSITDFQSGAQVRAAIGSVPAAVLWNVTLDQSGASVEGSPTYADIINAINTRPAGTQFFVHVVQQESGSSTHDDGVFWRYPGAVGENEPIDFIRLTKGSSEYALEYVSCAPNNIWSPGSCPANSAMYAATASGATNATYATRIGSSSVHPAIGRANRPVYVNANGEIVAGDVINDGRLTVQYKGGSRGTFSANAQSDVTVLLPTSQSIFVVLVSSGWTQQADGTYQQAVSCGASFDPAQDDLIVSPVLPATKAGREVLYQSMISCMSGSYDIETGLCTFIFTCDASAPPSIDIGFTVTKVV